MFLNISTLEVITQEIEVEATHTAHPRTDVPDKAHPYHHDIKQ